MKSKTLVFLQFLIIGFFIYRGDVFKASSTAIGMGVVALIFGAWALWEMRKHLSAFPELREDAQLLTAGPYAIVRNPMYFSLLVLFFPAAFLPIDKVLIAAYVLLFFVLREKMEIEEVALSSRFAGFNTYKKSVKSMIPWIV